MVDIMGKWQFIMDFCEKYGLKKSYELAKEIRDTFIEIYGDEETSAFNKVESRWRGYISKKEKIDIELAVLLYEGVIDAANYQKGCSEESSCETCKFGKKAGICLKKGSLFHKFIAAYMEETGITEDVLIEYEDYAESTADLIEGRISQDL